MTVATFADNHQHRYAALLVRAAHVAPLNVGMLNVRAVRNKSATVCDWIASSKLRLAAVVETWYDSGECPDLTACTPPGYSFIERARPRSDENETSICTNHGDVCLFPTAH